MRGIAHCSTHHTRGRALFEWEAYPPGGPPLVLNSEMARAFVLSVRSSGRAAPPSGRAFALSVLGNGPSVRPLLLRSRSLFAAYMPCLLLA